LSLVSTAPIPAFGGFPIYVTLDPANLANDVGQITINGTAAGRTFDSFFDVFFDGFLAPGGDGVGCAGPTPYAGTEHFISSGSTWQPTPTPATVIVNGIVGDQAANQHSGLGPTEVDFFPDPTLHTAPDGAHVIAAAITPIPGVLPLFASGFGGVMGLLAWRRKHKAAGRATA
jgi:hypothetical protein